MQAPIINLNGTSKSELLEQHLAAADALRDAALALGHGPNGRDYQTRPGAYDIAVAEHCDRLKRLDAILCEILDIAEQIDAQ